MPHVPTAMFGCLVAMLSLLHTTPLVADDQLTARGKQGMVVSVSAPASDVGLQTLKEGGNAVDAAIATALALAVTHPPAGNIGGGGFMLILPPGEKPICIDYRETAPAAAMKDLFADGANRHSAIMVGVPGTLRGLQL